MSNEDLSGVMLDGADFENSWFCDATFNGASLRGASFRQCNVKCASFVGADLTNANFELALIESIDLEKATSSGVRYVGASYCGVTLAENDRFS